jgi:hypothetical protein
MCARRRPDREDVRSRLASAWTNLSWEHASLNSGASQASCGSSLSTKRTSEARLFSWMWRARYRPRNPIIQAITVSLHNWAKPTSGEGSSMYLGRPRSRWRALCFAQTLRMNNERLPCEEYRITCASSSRKSIRGRRVWGRERFQSRSLWIRGNGECSSPRLDCKEVEQVECQSECRQLLQPLVNGHTDRQGEKTLMNGPWSAAARRMTRDRGGYGTRSGKGPPQGKPEEGNEPITTRNVGHGGPATSGEFELSGNIGPFLAFCYPGAF